MNLLVPVLQPLALLQLALTFNELSFTVLFALFPHASVAVSRDGLDHPCVPLKLVAFKLTLDESTMMDVKLSSDAMQLFFVIELTM